MPRRKPTVAMLSLWRNDEKRGLFARCDHLLAKKYTKLRYIWLVGDSDDETERMLARVAEDSARDVTLLRADTGITRDTPDWRLERLSQTVNVGFDALTDDDELLCVHESDLESPHDVVDRLVNCPGDVRAGMVRLGHNGIFYDVYAYRKDGQRFGHDYPYIRGFDPAKPFEVDSVGSCWLAPAEDFRGDDPIRAHKGAVIDLMRGLKERGRVIMVDPTLEIIQPKELWESRQHGSL